MPPSKTPLRGSPLTQHIRLTSLAQNSLRRNFVYAEDVIRCYKNTQVIYNINLRLSETPGMKKET